MLNLFQGLDYRPPRGKRGGKKIPGGNPPPAGKTAGGSGDDETWTTKPPPRVIGCSKTVVLAFVALFFWSQKVGSKPIGTTCSLSPLREWCRCFGMGMDRRWVRFRVGCVPFEVRNSSGSSAGWNTHAAIWPPWPNTYIALNKFRS